MKRLQDCAEAKGQYFLASLFESYREALHSEYLLDIAYLAEVAYVKSFLQRHSSVQHLPSYTAVGSSSRFFGDRASDFCFLGMNSPLPCLLLLDSRYHYRSGSQERESK
jgi:hypothetical protein